jgi:hypothetical protein
MPESKRLGLSGLEVDWWKEVVAAHCRRGQAGDGSQESREVFPRPDSMPGVRSRNREGDAMSFKSPELIDAWSQTRAYPAIHDEIFKSILENSLSKSFCDLGCCYGLLGQRIMDAMPGVKCIGFDADYGAIKAGQSAGVQVEMYQAKIDRTNMGRVVGMMRECKVSCLIARRILPEIWGDDIEGGKQFAALMADNFVNEIYVQGRLASERAVNNLSSVGAEIEMLSEHYRPTFVRGQIARLIRKRT